ncbi:MAG: hypothetical protein NC212_04870 [Staphylococcus sp.]|nr:hypothetical protein [Staphylococcus sp.]
MKVITLNEKQFASACRELAAMAAERLPEPEMIVGIKTGGEYVAREIHTFFPASMLALVELRRPSTAAKSPLQGVLSRLPVRVLDWLRIAEARVLALRPARRRPKIEISSDLRRQLPRHILVVDDAVDSGTTMDAIVSALRRARPDVEVRTAVITVTTSSPAISPDYALYRDKTLIRFPWSMDMKR